MRFFKAHPALAALLVLAIIGVVAPVAYAIVDHVFLSIDTSKSEKEIEADVKRQLDNSGHGNATVTATKTDHEYAVAISSEDPALANVDLEVDGPDGKKHQLHIDIPPTMPEAQQQAVGEAVSAALSNVGNHNDLALESELKKALDRAGVKNYEAHVNGTSISVVVK